MHTVAVLALVAAGTAACGGSSRDVVPQTRDVVAHDTTSQGAYAYIAKRPMGSVALAGVAGLDADAMRNAVDRLAGSLDSCSVDLARKGKLVDGAIRIAAAVAPDGGVAISHVTIAPGDAVAANAILCVVAPLKLLSFPPTDGGSRTFAIDATWGPPGKRD